MHVLLMDVEHTGNAGTTQVYIKQANLSIKKKINQYNSIIFLVNFTRMSVVLFINLKTPVLTVPRKAV